MYFSGNGDKSWVLESGRKINKIKTYYIFIFTSPVLKQKTFVTYIHILVLFRIKLSSLLVEQVSIIITKIP